MVDEKYAYIGTIESPAACPKCGSMDVRTPFCGRRTGVYFSSCRDCGATIRSCEPFEIEKRGATPIAIHGGHAMEQLTAIRMRAMQKMNVQPEKPYVREPGEEG